MAENTITITLKGLSIDEGDVRLYDFENQIRNLRKALQNKERLVSGDDKRSIYYKIINIKKKSPISITVQAVPYDTKKTQIVTDTVSGFFSDLEFIRKHKAPPKDIDLTTIESYRNLGISGEKKLEQITIKNGRRRFTLDAKFEQQIERAIGPDRFEYGSVVGLLEMINIHHVKKFYIFPIIGTKRIECTFGDDLLPIVKEALSRRVSVSGRLKYKQWEDLPYAISALEIVLLKEDNELPRFSDLIGADPTACENLTVLEYMKRVRDEGW